MYQTFYEALISQKTRGPTGLTAWNGSDTAVRFAVYRNNVISSLIDALADNFPVLQAQVGEIYFRGMTAEFIRESPPVSPVLAYYGEELAAWIAAYPPLGDWPWLADLAKLEYAFIIALHAADNTVSEKIFSKPIEPLTEGLILDSSLQVINSFYAIYQIWCAHQQGESLSKINPYQSESVLLFRHKDDVLILPVDIAGAQFICSLIAGKTMMQSLEDALQYDSRFTPENTLVQLHHYKLLVAVRDDIC